MSFGFQVHFVLSSKTDLKIAAQEVDHFVNVSVLRFSFHKRPVFYLNFQYFSIKSYVLDVY